MGSALLNVDIEKPRYDQSTYTGRAKHFFQVTNPLNLFVTSKTLENARTIVTKYRNREPLPENLTEEDLWRAKTLYDSAFHPDTGEKQIIIGRMSAQVPMNMIITGGMMAFYQTTPAVLFWQWINQSFNAIVNYTNRSGDAKFTTKQLLTSYVCATTGAVATAVGLNKLVKNAPPLVGRLVPLAAVAAANCINIPLMRIQCCEPIPNDVTERDLWRAKVLYDSAFHPDTGEKMTLLGRMSAQVPGNLFFNAGMLTFYKSTPAVVFWQWFNQSFNALVNYTNRSGDLEASNKQIMTSYVLATAGAVGTALGLNKLLRCSPPLFKRFVPFAAVAAAHCVNIPIMRAQELKTGTPIFDDEGRKVGYSKYAAQSGISKVIISRILMQAPSMLLTPILINHLERMGYLCRYPWMALPVTVGFAGLCLTISTPMCCAIFRQISLISYKDLEPDLKDVVDRKYGKHPPIYFYYNKGL